ncbi:MAG: type II toxin-antitoxin system VapC family toxin [Actinobacteria bacterium]|nr:type II toxin-antitoxin system VapC family toxin [Actinomycetota bacterium]
MILLDTHALLWWQAGGARLSARAAREIARADAVLVSPVSCWEIATLLRKGRIRLDRGLHGWVRDLLDGEQVRFAELSPEVGATAGNLEEGFPGDPADRLLWATASDLLVPLVTKDQAIRAFAAQGGDVRVVW